MNAHAIARHCLFMVLLCSTGTAQSPYSFFPHHVGNIWQYRSQFTQQVVSTVRFVRDSSATNGSVFVWYIIQGIGGGVYEIDSSFNVWEVSGDSLTRVRHEYSLAATIGQSWHVNPMPPPYDSARVVGIYPESVFGQPVTITKIDYWQRFELGDSLWYGTRYLASNFGLVRWDIEPSDIWYLSGANVDSVQWGQIVSVRQEDPLPDEFVLFQNYPNPFNSSTKVTFNLPSTGRATLGVYDVLGRAVATLLDEMMQAGTWSVTWNAAGYSSGTYFAKLQSTGQIKVIRIILMK